MKIYHGRVKAPKPNQVLVYGSNTQARNGKGTAYLARCTGAKPFIARGWSSVSHYAICTKDLTQTEHPSISAVDIIDQISKLYIEARKNSNLDFLVPYSASGPNLNGYTPQQMAEMFVAAGSIPDNIVFETNFADLIIIFSGIKDITKVSINGPYQQTFVEFIKNCI
jgi:hypothetical protein